MDEDEDEDEERSTAEWQRCQMLWKLMEIRETIVIYHHLQFSISSRDSRRNSHVDDDDDDDDDDDVDDDDAGADCRDDERRLSPGGFRDGSRFKLSLILRRRSSCTDARHTILNTHSSR